METYLVDSHAHLNMFETGEMEAVLERAAAAGVGGVVVPATGPGDLRAVVELVESRPERLAGAVGVHPHEASSLDAPVKRLLRSYLERPGVVAVGEIGLDYHYMNSPREDQLRTLQWQMELAREAGLPVILHNRESWEDLAGFLERFAGEVGGVCHSFSEGEAVTRTVVELGFFVGISGMVTFRKADNVRRTAAAAGIERILVETDSPFLAPVPHRGRRNEPAFVVHVAEAVAAVLETPPARLAAAATANTRRLFGLEESWGIP